MLKAMKVRIADIPSGQAPSWAAVVAVLRAGNRPEFKMHWEGHRPREGNPFSDIEIEVPGDDVDALRAEIAEAVDLVNDIVEREPTKTMARADIGLTEVLIQ